MKSNTLLKSVLICLAVVWLFAVTFNYYIVHKPFSVENVLAILNTLGDIAVAGAMFALASALGRRVTRALAFESPLEGLVLQTGLGLGLISLATLGLGLCGLLNPLIFWVLFFIAVFLLRSNLRAVWFDLRAIQLPMSSRFERILAIFCVFALVLAFLVALTPPFGWDAQQYHLVGPKLAIAQSRISPPPDNVALNYPSLTEMLFLAAMLLKGDVAAQLIHFGFFILGLAALFAFAMRYCNSVVAWLAVTFLVAVPSLLAVSSAAYVDLTLAFYAFAALYVTIIACESPNPRHFVFAGVFAGLAVGVKYTGVIVPVALVVLILLSRRFSFLIWNLLAVVLVAAPWFIRNFVFTGNPIYPFLIGGPYWDIFQTTWFSRLGSGLINTPLLLLIVPWDATISGNEGTTAYDASIGPLLLAFLPFLIFGIVRSRSSPPGSVLRNVLIFVALLYAFWLAQIAQSKLLIQTRLVYLAFPALAFIAAIGFDRLRMLDLPQFSLQRFARLLIGLVVGLTGLSYALGFGSDAPLAYLAGFESRDTFLVRHLGAYYSAVQFVNTQLPPNANVLFLWEPRSYYVQRTVQPDTLLDMIPHTRWKYPTADAMVKSWRDAGYTHVLLNRGGLDYMLQTGYDPVTREDALALQDLLTRYGKQIYGKTPLQIITRDGKPAVAGAEDDRYAVYELTASPSSQGQ